MQISTAFTYYQFNFNLEAAISNVDLRTQYFGRVSFITNIITTVFQFWGGYLLIENLGLKKAHFFVPIILGFNCLAVFIFPNLLVTSFALIIIKTIDYSLFGIIREMLYIPLKLEEKFKAKALIDVFAGRTAKALASFIILFLQLFMTNVLFPIRIIALSIFIFWIFSVRKLFTSSIPEENLTNL